MSVQDELTILRNAVKQMAEGSATDTDFISIAWLALRDADAAKRALGSSMRERAARVIDPDAFVDASLQDDLTPSERMYFDQARFKLRSEALGKADVILAMRINAETVETTSVEASVVPRWDDDGYWLDCVRRTKSNSAIAGFKDFADFIESGAADDRALSGISSALRSLSQHCRDQLSERREAQRLARYGHSEGKTTT
jgi:hypothetical protein